jgi:3-methylcrotonyl-CoA carboxylase alpha subunit
LKAAGRSRAAEEASAEAADPLADPWSRRDGWRLHGGARRHFDIQHAGALHAVALARPHATAADGALELQIGDARWPLRARALGDARDGRRDGGKEAHQRLHGR